MACRCLLLAGCSLLLAGLPIGAQTGAREALKGADKAFAMKAAQGGMAEVQMGKLAADKANDADLKAFGQRMVDDHGKANDQLKAIDQKIGLTPPEGISAKEQAAYDRLSRLSGPVFDKTYVKEMLMDHQEDIREFQKEANSGGNPDLKSFASETLPTLQSHLDSIKSIQSKLASQGTK
jgi:putative membrane protein